MQLMAETLREVVIFSSPYLYITSLNKSTHMKSLKAPDLRDVFQARLLLKGILKPTPLLNWSSLDKITGCHTYLKLESILPSGSFKVRGSIFLISQLSGNERRKGVIAASTGNFALGVAYASKLYGVKATVVMPNESNPLKVESLRRLGAEVVFHGEKFDDARAYAGVLSKKKGYRYIHAANESLLIAGVGTYSLEVVEELPDLDAFIVPVGGGSGASGAITTLKSIDKSIKVIGVQSQSSPGAYLSWKAGKIRKAKNETYAEGLATGQGFELTQQIMKEYLDDFILVSDEDIMKAQKILFNATHIFPESASASTLAASLKLKRSLRGKKVVLAITGGNSSQEEVDRALSR